MIERNFDQLIDKALESYKFILGFELNHDLGANPRDYFLRSKGAREVIDYLKEILNQDKIIQ